MRKPRLYYVSFFVLAVAGLSIWALSEIGGNGGPDDKKATEQPAVVTDAADPADDHPASDPSPGSKAPQPAPLLAPQYEVDVQRDIVYAGKKNETEAEEPLKLDLYMPVNDNSTGRPVFLFIHGGGYTSGSKQDGAAYAAELAQRGYAVVAMDYRLKRDPFIQFSRTLSDAYEDIGDVFDWIADHAQAYGLDAGQVAIGGDSAGGYLSMNFVNRYLDQYPAVQDSVFAIVDIYGGELEGDVHEQLPPMMIVHGTIDQLIPYTQSLNLQEELQQRGLYETMLTLENVGHDYKNAKYFDEIVGTTAHFLWNVLSERSPDQLPKTAGIEAVSGDSFELKLPGGYQTSDVSVELPEGWVSERSGMDALRIQIPAGLDRGSRSVIVSRQEGEDRGRFAVSVTVIDPLEPRFETYYDAKKRTVETRMNMNNRSAKPFSGAFALKYETAESTQGEFKTEIKELGSGESVEYLIPALVQGRRTVEAFDASGRPVQKTEDVFHALLAHKKSVPVQIDGSLKEWKAQARYEVSEVVMDGWNGADDLSALGYVSWDDDNLYLALDVTDDTHSQPTQGGSIWGGDSVQLAVGLAGDDGSDPLEYSELGAAMDDSGALSHWRWIAPTGFPTGIAMQLDNAVTREDGHTIYELAIPWGELLRDASAAKPGSKLKFSLLVNDNDGAGRKGWLEYNSGIGTAKDIHAFGDVFLGE